jgi:hypothetical protein
MPSMAKIITLRQLGESEMAPNRLRAQIRSGSRAPFWPPAHDFRYTLINGHHQTGPVGPFRANRRPSAIPSLQLDR